MTLNDAIHELKIRVAGLAVIFLNNFGAKDLGRFAFGMMIKLIDKRSERAITELEHKAGLNG
jgi:hypothetical protein